MFVQLIPPLHHFYTLKLRYAGVYVLLLMIDPEPPRRGSFNVLTLYIPLIGKDGDDVIDNITCELTGTESINTQT